MARGSTRVVLDQRELDAVVNAAGTGAYEFAGDVVDEAAENAPDATPYGVGIVSGGGAIGFANGRQIGSQGEADAPRELDTGGRRQIAVAGGFRFPAHLQELGTIRHRAQPFLSPALERRRARLGEYAAAAVKQRRGGR